MNTRFKMKHSNVKARRWLEMHGYRDIQMFPHTRFSKDINLEELKFDGICISNDKVALFQIKSNCKPTIEMQNKFKEFAEEYFVKLFWFNCPDYEEIDVYEYG